MIVTEDLTKALICIRLDKIKSRVNISCILSLVCKILFWHSIAPGHLIARSPRRPVTSSPGHLVTRAPRRPLTSSPGHLVARSPRLPGTSSPGHLVTRSPRHPVTWSPGHLVTRSPRLKLWTEPHIASRWSPCSTVMANTVHVNSVLMTYLPVHAIPTAHHPCT